MENNAALMLGYSQLSWDDPWPAAADKYFADLTTAEQKAAKELGFDAKTWDNESGNEERPAAWKTVYAKLSDKEKAAAKALGYTEFTWDRSPPATPDSMYKTFANLRTFCSLSVHASIAAYSVT